MCYYVYTYTHKSIDYTLCKKKYFETYVYFADGFLRLGSRILKILKLFLSATHAKIPRSWKWEHKFEQSNIVVLLLILYGSQEILRNSLLTPGFGTCRNERD